MNESLVSVIIPTYKRQASIVKRAIASVLCQTYNNFEVIIVDDSPDEYIYRSEVENMILLLNSEKVKYIKHDVNKGACAARNTGIIASRGDFVAFLDDDDEWLPNKLEKQMSLMDDSDFGLVYCRHFIVDDNKKSIIMDKRMCYKGEVFAKLIISNFVGSTSFVLIRRECIDKVGMFNTELESAQDYEMWLRIANFYKITFANDPLVKYHIHGDERITSNAEKKIQGLEKVNIIFSDYLALHKKVKAIRLIKIVPYYLAVNKHDKAWNTYLAAVKLAPFNIKYNLKYLKRFIKC